MTVKKRAKKLTRLSDLTPDNKNANKGTEHGLGMLEHSLRQYGAGRGILVDRAGRVIAGNKTIEQAVAIGLKKIRVVETTGDEIVVTQRMDLDLDDPKARALAVADNRVAELDLAWDADVLTQLAGAGVDLSAFWHENELARLLKNPDAGADDTAPQLGGLEYRVVVDCKSEAQQRKLLERFEKEGLPCRALIS